MRFGGAGPFAASAWFAPTANAAGWFDQEYLDDVAEGAVQPPIWGYQLLGPRRRRYVPEQERLAAHFTDVDGHARLFGANTTRKGRSPRFARARATAALLME